MNHLTIWDWGIWLGLVAVLLVLLVYCRRYTKSPAQFLAAGRSARRYLLAIAGDMAGLGAISVIAAFEQYYQSGFSPFYWGFITGVMALALTASGFVSYRLRETRVLTMAQFFEIRYSRKLRIFAGMTAWVSGVLNYGIFPAVSVRFFLYFCNLPPAFQLGAITVSTYVFLLALFLGIGVLFAIGGGQVAIMVTDFFQGAFCNIAFLLLLVFLLLRFDWGTVSGALVDLSIHNPDKSLVNPFATSGLRDFNMGFFLIALFLMVFKWKIWLGSQGFMVSAASPHEAKMGNLLGNWRGLLQSNLLILIPLCAIVVLQEGLAEFAILKESVTETLSGIGNSTLREQLQVSVLLGKILPAGLLGVFGATMFAAMLSTDDTYLHSWGSILIQDVILPLRRKKEPLAPKTHINLLRASIILVALIAFLISWLFQQTQAILLYFTVTSALFSVGAVVIGGLYWKKGTTLGAWSSMTAGASTAVTGLLLCKYTPGWFQKSVDGVAQFHVDGRRIPLFNEQQVAFTAAVLAIALYIGVSLIERYWRKLPDFNLDQMLHRGQYADEGDAKPATGLAALGFTDDFSTADKIIYIATLGWTLLWSFAALVLLVLEKSGLLEVRDWMRFWTIYMFAGIAAGVIGTVWLLCGGIRDIAYLFRTLSRQEIDDSDDGSVKADEPEIKKSRT